MNKKTAGILAVLAVAGVTVAVALNQDKKVVAVGLRIRTTPTIV